MDHCDVELWSHGEKDVAHVYVQPMKMNHVDDENNEEKIEVYILD